MSLVEKVGIAINEQFDIIAQHVRYDLKKACPKRTGEAASAITIQKQSPDVIFVGGSNLHLYYADQGNRPNSGGRIVPTRAKALFITNGKGQRIAFRASVSPYEGKHFVRDVANKYR